MELVPLAQTDRAAAEALLTQADLPIDDLDDPSIALFAAHADGVLAGVVGVQRCGDAALLRSLVVAPAARGRGWADRLCAHVLAFTGTAPVYLLTTTARAYFARLGFEAIDRADVPAAIRATAQFASLCPATATVMRRGTPR